MPKTVPAMLITKFASLVERLPLSKAEVAARVNCDLSTLYRWCRGETRAHPAAVQLIRQLAEASRPNLRRKAQFRFIDLFAGIGGMRLGLESARGRCVFTSEWNAFSRTTYQRNFADGPDHPFVGDITQIEPDEIPEHDLLAAGFPCQPFSIAGVSKKNALGRPHGFRCKEQGNLFFEIAEILNIRRPAAFLLENVKNLRNHDQGKTFKVIRRTLEDELGYHIQYRVINAKAFVPQNRERIFIVGFRERTAFDFNKLHIAGNDTGPRLRQILHPEDASELEEPPYTTGPKAEVAPKYILTEHLWTYLREYARKHREAGHGFGFGLVGPNETARTLSARYFKDGSEILIRRPGKRPRRLTPRECARLMGFDTRGRLPFEIPVSDTQAYKQFGNAVVVPVVEAVGRHMAPYVVKLIGGQQLELGLDVAAAN